eukprot:602487-Prymnesium_polylepis.1
MAVDYVSAAMRRLVSSQQSSFRFGDFQAPVVQQGASRGHAGHGGAGRQAGQGGGGEASGEASGCGGA